MTGLAGLFDLPVLREITLWVLAVASLLTVFQRMVIVYKQTVDSPGLDA
jgi:CDP-diacylglycerol--glycerol-3-phosphate 3-phosphatidyltransferase